MTDKATYLRHRDCDHKWEPVSMILHPVSQQPDLERGKVYMICRRCMGWTYDEFEWVGWRLDGAGIGGSVER